MKYKILENASLPECSVGLWKGAVLDDEIDKRLTKSAIDRALKNKWIEPMGVKKEKKAVSDERN